MKAHYVPRFYLQYFCDPTCPPGRAPFVWYRTRTSATWKRRAAKNLATRPDFYSFGHVEQSPEQRWFETALSSIEGAAATMYHEHLSPWTTSSNGSCIGPSQANVHLNRETREVLSFFLATLSVRTVPFLRIFGEAVCKAIHANPALAPKDGSDPGSHRELVRTALGNSASIADFLLKGRWRFLAAGKDAPFASSDNPVYGVFDRRDTALTTAPLSPRLALFVEHGQDPTDDILVETARRSDVEFVNTRTVATAELWFSSKRGFAPSVLAMAFRTKGP